tara:strand:+ start:3966 stop:4724 length:759 start_codon:yes stop_codon:yes gene_type:complete
MSTIFILSLIQGVTEFLPISSSSHLIIFSEFINFNNKNLLIDVSLHIGSFLAVITYFYKDIVKFIQNKFLFLKIIVASIPITLVGFILVKSKLIYELRSIEIIGWTTIIFGILLYLSDRYETKKKIKDNFYYKDVIYIGLFQVLSLIPGVSRSGITITAARFLKFSREDSLKISFLLSIPTLGAVSIFGLNNLIISNEFEFSKLSIISMLFSFIFSLITIELFFNYVQKFNFNIFVIYRIILGIILIGLIYL